MAAKRSKGGSKKRSGGNSAKGKRGAPRNLQKTEEPSVQNAYERVAFIRPFWESLSSEERASLLTVTLDEVRAKAQDHAEKARNIGKAAANDPQLPSGRVEARIEGVLAEGLERISRESTWKVWRWGDDGKPYTDAEAFRKDAEEQHFSEELRALLPRDEGKPVEKPVEAALRERMTNLLGQIHMQLQNAQEAWRRGQRTPQDQVETSVRDGNIDLVIAILEGLQQEHQCLYHTILTPVTDFVCGLLPAKDRKSKHTELFFEDLEKLPPEEVARLYEWLTEKVDSLCAKLKPDPKEEEVEEEDNVGDIDLFSLTGGSELLTVNPKWLQHLQERRLSDEGQPQKVKEGEDPHKVGLVLEWVYGSIVSTAEKARDGAKRPLGSWQPTIKQAKENLLTALNDQRDWEVRACKAKQLLKSMLESRKHATDWVKETSNVSPDVEAGHKATDETADLSDQHILKVLKREELLTRAKLHVLQYERMMGESQLRTLRAELMQGEPELERLKRELEEVKNTPRGLEGTFRTAAEKERHRAQLADSLLEEQLEVQSAFREQGTRLQGIYDKRQRTEIEMAKREQEITQLKSWQTNVNRLISRFEAALGQPVTNSDSADCTSKLIDEAHADGCSPSKTAEESVLVPLRQTFNRDFKKQLYTDQDDREFFDRIKAELKQVERKLEEGAVVLQHLEMFLINVACDDPGAAIGTILVLPLLQERLDQEAMKFATHKASLAEQEILEMEKENTEKQNAEAAKKQKQKKKLKDKVRQAKERRAAELKAKEEMERAQQEEQQHREKQRLEAELRRRDEEMARLKREEEELIEKRRQELLREENGYWRLRMEAGNGVVSKDALNLCEKEGSEQVDEDNFQSVSSSRRRAQERRQQQSRGVHQRALSFGLSRWGSGPDMTVSGHSAVHRRQTSADLDSVNHRRSLSYREGSSTNRQAHKLAQRSSCKVAAAFPLQNLSRDPNSPVRQRNDPLPTSRTRSLPVSTGNTHMVKVWHNGDSAMPAPQAEVPMDLPDGQAVQRVVSPENSKTKGQDLEDAEQTGVQSTVNKPTWAQGEIPAEVLSYSRRAKDAKELRCVQSNRKLMLKESGTAQSQSSSEVDKAESVSSPETPEVTEVEALSIRSDSDISQQNAFGCNEAHPLQIRTVLPDQAEIEVLKDLAPSSPGRQLASFVNKSPTFQGFRGNGEQFFRMVRSMSGAEDLDVPNSEEKLDRSEEEDQRGEADEFLVHSEELKQENEAEQGGPIPTVMAPPIGAPPFGMPLAGPMGPMGGFHPGIFQQMRPACPTMRPMIPMMMPPGFVRPEGPLLSPHTTSPPSSPHTPPTSCGVSCGSPPQGHPRPCTPGMSPVFFFPPMMAPGPPLMPPYMPMLPGQWVGYPMGHPSGPPFPSNDRRVRKFALRPTAKEFIPRSMMEEVSEEVEAQEVTIDSTGGSDSERDADETVDRLTKGADAIDSAVQSTSDLILECDKNERTAFVKVVEEMTTRGCEDEIPKSDVLNAVKVAVQPIEQKA